MIVRITKLARLEKQSVDYKTAEYIRPGQSTNGIEAYPPSVGKRYTIYPQSTDVYGGISTSTVIAIFKGSETDKVVLPQAFQQFQLPPDLKPTDTLISTLNSVYLIEELN